MLHPISPRPIERPATELAPPVAKQVPQERTFHGDTVVDEYEWLRDKDDPEAVAYLEAENAYTEQATAHLAGLRDTLFEEIRSRTQETDMSVPARIGSYWYYGRSIEGKQYGISCRCPVDSPDDWDPPVLEHDTEVPEEECLLDLNELAEGHDFFSLGASSVSPDGTQLAFSTDTVGDERFLLQVKDLTTGEMLPDQIPGTAYGATWSLCGQHLFYTTVDEAWRPHKVWRHDLGTRPAQDVEVFHEPDERFWLSMGRTRSDAFLVIGVGSKTTTEYRVLDAADPTGEWRVVSPRRQGVEYGVEHAVIGGEECFLVLHNDGAENFTLARTPVTSTSHEDWEPVFPYDPAVRLEDVEAFAGHLVVHERKDGLTQLRIVELTGDGLGEDYSVDFGHPVYTVGAGANPEFHQPRVRLGYTTLATPPAVYDFVVATRELHLLKQMPVLGDFDPERYEQHREWATAEDGTRVPISIVCPKDAPRDGSMPMLLYGYGSYESSTDPYFTISRLSLLDRGIGLRDRARARRRRAGSALVRRGQDAVEAEHLHRLRRLRPAPGLDRLDVPGPAGRGGWQRRGAAHGRRGEHRPRRVPRDRGRRGLRRRAHHDPRPVAAADRRGVGGVGQPARGPRGLRLHEVLLALRERRAEALPLDPRRDLAQRHPRAVRGAGQVGRQAARHRAGAHGLPAQDRDVGRPRRRQRPLQRLAGPRVLLRLGPRQARPRLS